MPRTFMSGSLNTLLLFNERSKFPLVTLLVTNKDIGARVVTCDIALHAAK